LHLIAAGGRASGAISCINHKSQNIDIINILKQLTNCMDFTILPNEE
jgi:hypothetical protein